MNITTHNSVTPFSMMSYDLSERGEKFRAVHKYKKLSQVGNAVEYEFEFCGGTKCSCKLYTSYFQSKAVAKS